MDTQTKSHLFFKAWQSDFLIRNKGKKKKFGEITTNIRNQQIIAYNKIRLEHIAKRKELLNAQ